MALPETDPHAGLIAKALGREPAAVRALVDLLSPVIARRVSAALWRRSPGRDVQTEMQDITQEVFLSLFAADGKALRAWDPRRGLSLQNFVGLIAQHQVVSILRTGKRSPWPDDPTDAAILDGYQGTEPAADAVIGSREQLVTLLERVRGRLSPRGLELFQRMIIEEESIEELGAATGLSRDALYQWKTRLLRLVREISAEIEAPPVSDPAAPPRSSRGGSTL
jgi:RNA polymerase sigma-70 factor (ECF subfamily)